MKLPLKWLLILALLPAVPAPAAAPKAAAGRAADELLAKANTCRDAGDLILALSLYRQAASAGNPQGALAAGQMLCQAGAASAGRERILKVSEGLNDLYAAATNRLPQACAELAGILQNGRGVQTNLIYAYAWMELAAASNRCYQASLDQMAVRMTPAQIQAAQGLAADYLLGHWPKELVPPVDDGDPRLRVQGITAGAGGPMVIVNDATFSEGDTQDVAPLKTAPHPATGKLTVTCLEIGNNYVLLSVAGENHLKLLSDARLLGANRLQ
jgi:hypothetical protein